MIGIGFSELRNPESQQAHLLSSETQATITANLAPGDRRLREIICSCVCSSCTQRKIKCCADVYNFVCRFEISQFQNEMEDMDQLLELEQSMQLCGRGSDPASPHC